MKKIEDRIQSRKAIKIMRTKCAGQGGKKTRIRKKRKILKGRKDKR